MNHLEFESRLLRPFIEGALDLLPVAPTVSMSPQSPPMTRGPVGEDPEPEEPSWWIRVEVEADVFCTNFVTQADASIDGGAVAEGLDLVVQMLFDWVAVRLGWGIDFPASAVPVIPAETIDLPDGR
jgi:hypothetical protein